MLNRPSDLPTLHKEQQKSKDSDRPTQTQKEAKRAFKLLTLRSFETSACRSHSFFFLLSPHPYSFIVTARPTVRERLLFAVTVDFPSTQCSHSSAREPSRHCGEPSDSELSQHASLISWQRRSMVMWLLKATLPSSQSSRKSATTSLDQPCPMTSIAWHSSLFSYTSQPREVSLAEQELIHSGLFGQPCLHMSPKSGN